MFILSDYGFVDLHCYSDKENFENDLPYFMQIIDSFRYDAGYGYSQITKNTMVSPSTFEFLVLLIPGVWIILVVVKSVKAEKTAFPMKWFYFYTYFLLPINVLFCLVLTPTIPQQSPFMSLSLLFNIALNVSVIIGLHKRRIWGWHLNWVGLVFLILFNILTIGIHENKVLF